MPQTWHLEYTQRPPYGKAALSQFLTCIFLQFHIYRPYFSPTRLKTPQEKELVLPILLFSCGFLLLDPVLYGWNKFWNHSVPRKCLRREERYSSANLSRIQYLQNEKASAITLASLPALDTSFLVSLPSTSHSPLSTSALSADPAPAFPVAREPLFSNTQRPHALKVAKLCFQNFSAVWHAK